MSTTAELPTSVTDTPPPTGTLGSGPKAGLGTLALISGLGLFLELLLIRWVTTEVRIFAYLQNTVLVVCFLGLGMGCWDSRRRFALRQVLVPLLVLAALLSLPPTRIFLGDTITRHLSVASGLLVWSVQTGSGSAGVDAAAGVVGLALTFGLMLLLWLTFVPVGRLLGRLMSDHPRPIQAYTVNVAASLIGVWAFVGCSGLGLSPGWWFAAFALAAVPLAGSGGRSRAGDLGLLAALVGLGVLAGHEPGTVDTRWSPYQKLTLTPLDPPPPASPWAAVGGQRPVDIPIGTYHIGVNNTGYQGTIDLRPERVAQAAAANPVGYPPAQLGLSQYDLPAKLHPAPRAALVVGAGSGNDVAGLLRNGVEQVTAVEIDPQIIAYGRQVHPERPYDSPRVRVVNDDARSFFATTAERFDLIVFGLLDSHTTTAMTNARLDHYVYTRESLARARDLLAPGGVLVLSFEAQKPFIADRMARGLTEVFGEAPFAFRVPGNGYGWGGVLFVAGDQPAVAARVAAQPRLAALLDEWQAAPATSSGQYEVPTDDWPYLYLEGRHIPPLYLLLGVALVALFGLGVRLLGTGAGLRGWGREEAHFALLGAAFMLLEVQNISKAAVVLGNTWEVSAVIISGVLVMILLANALAGPAGRLPAWPVYLALVGSCLGLYLFDLSRLAFLPYPAKAAVVGLLTSLPMLFSGLVFARSFAAAGRKDLALGANLFGSLAGSLFQSATFVTGIKALLLMVAGLYLLAVLTRPRPSR